MKEKVYIFDFDGTLTTHDTLLKFIPFVVGRLRFYAALLLFSPLLVLMKLQQLAKLLVGTMNHLKFQLKFMMISKKMLQTVVLQPMMHGQN